MSVINAPHSHSKGCDKTKWRTDTSPYHETLLRKGRICGLLLFEATTNNVIDFEVICLFNAMVAIRCECDCGCGRAVRSD